MNLKTIAIAALAVLAFDGAAAAGELAPMHSRSIDLGTMRGIAYYTVSPDGSIPVARGVDSVIVCPETRVASNRTGAPLSLWASVATT